MHASLIMYLLSKHILQLHHSNSVCWTNMFLQLYHAEILIEQSLCTQIFEDKSAMTQSFDQLLRYMKCSKYRKYFGVFIELMLKKDKTQQAHKLTDQDFVPVDSFLEIHISNLKSSNQFSDYINNNLKIMGKLIKLQNVHFYGKPWSRPSKQVIRNIWRIAYETTERLHVWTCKLTTSDISKILHACRHLKELSFDKITVMDTNCRIFISKPMKFHLEDLFFILNNSTDDFTKNLQASIATNQSLRENWYLVVTKKFSII